MRRAAAVFVALALAATACGARDGTVAIPTYDYVPCGAGTPCGDGATCHTITWRDGSGGMCTADCAMPSTCPHTGRCLDVNASGTFLCYGTCFADTDCVAPQICQPLSTGGSVCLPH